MNRLILIILLATSCSHFDPHLRNKAGAITKLCKPPDFYSVAINTPLDIKEIIHRAFNYWNQVTGKSLLVSAGDDLFHLVPEDGDMFDREAGRVFLVGVYNDVGSFPPNSEAIGLLRTSKEGCTNSGVILINPFYLLDNRNTEELESCLRHEAGHILGLAHNPVFTDLMALHLEPTLQHPVDASDEEIHLLREWYKEAKPFNPEWRGHE